MSINQEIEILPVLLVECIINKKFFDASNVKRRQEEIRNYVNMNSVIVGGAYKRK